MAVGLALASRLDPRGLERPVALCCLGGLIWGAASLVVAPHPHAGALALYYLALVSLAMVAGAQATIDRTLIAFSLGIGVSAILAVAQVAGWNLVPQGSAPAGLFFNSELLAELAAPLCVWAFWCRRWTLAVLMAIPVGLCHSRIALLLVLVGLLYGIKFERRWIKPALLILISGIGMVSIFALGLGKFDSATDRIGLWLTAGLSITPWGRGLGWWEAAHPSGFQTLVHSDALQFMVELGLGGLFFLAIPPIILWRKAGSVAERALFVCLTVDGLVSFPLHFPASAFLFGMVAGHLSRARGNVRVVKLAGRVDLCERLRREDALGAVLSRSSPPGRDCISV